jgi:hypothetical protein
MRKTTLVALASVVIVVGPAFAGGGPGGGGVHGGLGRGGPGHGGPGRGGNFHGRHDGLRSSIPTRLFPHHRRFAGQPFFYGQRFFYGQQFFPFGGGYGVYAPPAYGYGYGYGYPAYAYSAPTYAVSESVPPPPMYYPSSSSYATPPMQGVIEFSSGKYVLQGDGSTYRWVWIPNPPPAPPAAAPSAAAAAPEPVRSLDFYRWTDAEGVTHFTDRLEQVPDADRSKVTKSRT